MSAHPDRRTTPVHDELHPLIYRAIIALTVWLVASIWALFGRGSSIGLTLGIITVFFLIVVGIPVLIWQTWRRNAAPDAPIESLRDWLSQSFETWTGATSGTDAAAQILLPIAAVAFGMTIFGLAFLFAVPHLGG